MQQRGKHAKNEDRRGDLVPFRSGKTLSVSAPSLAIVGLAIAGLLNAGLQSVSDVRADVKHVVPSNVELLSVGEGFGDEGQIVASLEIGDES